MPAPEVVSTRNVSLCILALFFCFFASPARAQLAITTPILTSAQNFRDLAGISASNGGTGFVNPASNFGVMRTGVIYRSDQLGSLNTADLATISRLGIGRDIDLRTPAEISQTPDVVPIGAAYTNVNIYGTPAPVPEPPFTAPPSVAISFMQAAYQSFVTDPVQRAGFRTVLITLANDPHADVYHCSGGKDRTGWTSAILESIAGVSPATIMNDYLATNSYTAAFITSSRAAILSQVPGANPATANALLGVQSSYLQAGLDQVISSYGSMYGYLTQGLGLTLADIYVLRAKMVNYLMLPGQAGSAGNAASGAAFLNALQNSPLSGRYTSYNYYLQSAVDEGTLGGVQTQVGGQVHADAASYLLRQPQRIDEAITPYANGRDLGEGQTRVWLAGFGGNFWSDGRNGAARSTEYSAGSIIGATRRINNQASVNLGVGYNWGSVASADATATINTVLATIGGRYGFSALDAGPYVEARADAGWVDYQSRRGLGGGLGTATGSTNGAVYGGRVGLGDVIYAAPFTVALQAGVRVSGVSLGSFNESGSDLALHVHGMGKTSSSLLADLEVSLDRQQLGAWTIAPAVTLGYERVLGNPQAESIGTLYGLAVSQSSAYDSHDLMKAGLGVTAERGAFTAKARCDGVIGDGAHSAGISGQLSLAYSF
ncbi:tyrosine-protein phosphatase [Fundidesulfovibrio terrae]|uniref:tyrosine-protein phosphatase n=1 Tax=Fundidesulfovibrio terrae TaxID=2922866 RepID=UPI001FAEB5CD|nr:tyrosine-protein phosphatase [Fundidesulfovibrio terrae]